VLPHFTATGPPEFITDSCGVMAGLRLGTSRGAILKGILEGATFYVRECIETLPETGIRVEEVRVAGGGSQSDAWVQLTADILGRTLTRPAVTEAGATGAAILAGVACGAYKSFDEGVEAMVRLDRVFEPNPAMEGPYARRFQHYRRLWPLMKDYLRSLL